ncbi:MRC1-like domain-containing protein [Trichophaea hybrida]|nr:MRC1-like domain-containing protein [Trichophaea hybrida]
MSSPASSTPGTPSSRRRDASPIILTPRSKVRALLAGSDSSDNEGPKSPSRRKSPQKTTTEKPLFALQDDTEDSDGAESMPSARPCGKLASRMYGAAAASAASDDDGLTAYERVKQSLVAEKNGNDSTSAKAPEGTIEDDRKDGGGDDDTDEDMPIAPRRKRASKPTASSPPGSPAQTSATSPVGTPARSSRESSPKPTEDSDSDDLPEDLTKNTRFLALVEKRKKEREAREAVERKKELERMEQMKQLEGGESGSDDDDNDRRMASQPTRPKRQAGKKALVEMHKESQRLARNMQLEHEARTRKKITKQSLFDKFNFKVTNPEPELSTASPKPPSPSESSSTSPPKSETARHSTPGPEPSNLAKEYENRSDRSDSEDLPDALDLLNSTRPATPKKSKSLDTEDTPRPKIDKGKGKAIESPPKVDKGKGKAIEPSPPPSPKQKKPMPHVKVHLPIRALADDSDSDLEIVDPEMQARDEAKRLLLEKRKLIASIRRPRPIPKYISTSPNGKAHISSKQLHLQLLQKGRLQAIREREEKIEELRAKGIIVQTAEEREREQQEVESLLEKARKEALEIKRRERKEEKLTKGEKVSDDENEDGDFEWMEEEEEEGGLLDESSVEVSDDEVDNEQQENGLIDGEADGSGSEEEGADVEMKDVAPMDLRSPAFSLSSLNPRERDSASPTPTPRLSDMPPAFIECEDSADDDGGFAPFKRKLPRKKQRVTDDDDEDENGDMVVPETQIGPKIPDIFKNAPQAPAMGMTQLFAGTLGGSAAFEMTVRDVGKVIDEMRKLPDEVLPNSQAPQNLDYEPDSVLESQVGGGLSLDYSQSQIDNQDSLPALTLDYSQSQVMDSQFTQQIPDPTQDSGFEKPSSPAPPRFEVTPEPPAGSIPTQILDEQFPETKKRSKGRLVKRAAADFSDEEKESGDDENDESDDDGSDDPENAFAVFKKAARKHKIPAKPFDKSKSGAKEMIDERAVESDDEYGGIGGGASEDEGDDEAGGDEEMKDLLDDEEQDIDEDAMAAFFAEREKLQDEKDVNRLFRNIQNGMLRKKRGADFDLDDDSDDEYMAQERRRRAKRRQMAQIRKALLQNENLGKIAEDPKKAAFFRVLEDNASDEEGDFLDTTEDDLFINTGDSQSQIPLDFQSEEPSAGQGCDSVDAPPQPQPRDPRRPVRSKKPALADIRETLSFLGVEENTLIDLSDSEDDSQRRRTTTAVIDRTLSRGSSSISVSTKLAFQTMESVGSGPAGFRVPSLLRRATGSSISGDSQSSGSATTERSLGDSQGLKKGGTKSCSINFHARTKIVGDGVGKAETKKMKEREREVKNRARNRGGLASLGMGGFS